MRFQISRNEQGEPVHVATDDGFMQTSRAFRPEEDGWMLDQLNPRDFAAIRIGDDTEWLVAEVNRLRRENFRLKGEVEQWRKAAGF